jgi:hypothetical protein
MKKMILRAVVTIVILSLIISIVKIFGFENGITAVISLMISENRVAYYLNEK